MEVRASPPSEVDGQHAKSGLHQRPPLLLPALLVETASMRQNDSAFAFSVYIGIDDASVLSWKGDVLSRCSEPRQKESC